MNGINKVILIGNVGNPQTRGNCLSQYFKCGLAINSSNKSASDVPTAQDADAKNVLWLDLFIFGKLGHLATEYIKSGDLLYVEGKLNKRLDIDGKPQVGIIVTKFQRLGRANNGNNLNTDSGFPLYN